MDTTQLEQTPAPTPETKTEAQTQAPVKAKRVRKAKDGNLVDAAKRVTKAAKAITAKRKASNIASTDANPARSIVPVKFKQAYAAHNDTCGDKLSLALKEHTTHKNEDGRDALDVPALRAVAKANGIDFAAYEGLNNGQKRMNVRNKLAGLLKAGKTVTVGNKKFADAGKALAKPTAATEQHAAA